MLSHINDAEFQGSSAEFHFDNVALLYIVRRLCGLAVYAYMLAVTGIICDGASFYYSGYL